MSKAQLEAEQKIRDVLARSNRFVERSVVAMYERQTTNEQAIEATTDHNGVGFNAFDATLLSSFAKQIIENKHGRAEGSVLTKKQRDIARDKMMRYARQLVEIAKEKSAEKQAIAQEPAEATVTSDSKPCFVGGCDGPRVDGEVLCADHMMNRMLVERLSREQFGYVFLQRATNAG